MVVLLLTALTTPVAVAHADELPTPDLHDDQPDNTDEFTFANPGDAHWIAGMAIVFGGLFLAAAISGPIVRSEMPQAVPDAMSHEEDPAVDRQSSGDRL